MWICCNPLKLPIDFSLQPLRETLCTGGYWKHVDDDDFYWIPIVFLEPSCTMPIGCLQYAHRVKRDSFRHLLGVLQYSYRMPMGFPRDPQRPPSDPHPRHHPSAAEGCAPRRPAPCRGDEEGCPMVRGRASCVEVRCKEPVEPL